LIDDGECSYPRVDYLGFARALLAASAPTPSDKQEAVLAERRIGYMAGVKAEREHCAALAQSAEQDRIDAEPVGYIEPQSLEYLKDPKFAEEPESHVRLWHPSNAPSRAIIPVFLAKDKK
jgi:hypothetical protein